MKKTKTMLIIVLAVAACVILAGLLFTLQYFNFDESKIITSCLVCDSSGIDDKSFNAEAWKGVLNFYKSIPQAKEGETYSVIACPRMTQYYDTLEKAVQEKRDLLIVTGYTFSEALDKLSLQYPEQKFLSVDYIGASRSNVLSYVFDMSQASYMVGAIAALQATAENIENPQFGFIGGYENEIITQFEHGYIQGIHSILPNATVLTRYIGSWIDINEAERQADAWYEDGVDTIFSAAGLCGTGTINVAKKLRKEGQNVWAIGVDSDQYEEGIYEEGKSAVLTSALKLVNIASSDGLRVVADQSFHGGVIELDMISGGVGYTLNNTAIKKEILQEIEQIKEDIVSGKIKIER